MNASEYYSGAVLGADDVDPKAPMVATIVSIGEWHRNEGGKVVDRKLQLELDVTEKTLLLNKTNAQYLMSQLGEETDEWIGATIQISNVRVQYMGKSVPGLRITGVKKDASVVRMPSRRPSVDAQNPADIPF